MPSLEELAEQHSSQLSSVLKSAVETISSDQEITFRLYVRQVLPLDGFVYWVNAEIISCDELCRLNIESPTRLKIKGIRLTWYRRTFALRISRWMFATVFLCRWLPLFSVVSDSSSSRIRFA